MLVTVTNITAAAINYPAVHEGGSGAVGGAKVNPLPYPFGHIGSLAASGTRQLPMQPSDWRYRPVYWVTHEPKDQWNDLVQRSIVTLTVAAQAGRRDSEELFITAV